MSRDIAIVSYSFRFPELDTEESLWNILLSKGSTFSHKPSNRTTSLPLVGSFFKNPDIFDYAFFSLTAQEAKMMDRQQRLLLELAWHCYEASYIPLKKLQIDSTGVFIGSMLLNQTVTDGEKGADRYLATGISESILSNRISYFLKLRGPSTTINTACSSSLTALQAAKDALLSKSCDYAFVGASNMLDSDLRYRSYKEMGILSENLEEHAFSSKTSGFVPGEGGVVLLLTTYEKAIEDGLNIHGIIKGCAVNHTGSFSPKALTSPSVSAQAECLRQALQDAAVQPHDIDYIECHGTGTLVGDPIELAALHQAYGGNSHTYPIGSIKNNIGHLEACAGLASVIKGLLMFKHNMLPPHTTTEHINPLFPLISKSFEILNTPRPFNPDRQRLIAISSFGFGGTNAHLLLADAEPPHVQEKISSHSYPFVLSAHSGAALDELKKKWSSFLSSHSLTHSDLQNISSQLIVRNQSFPYRYAELPQVVSFPCTPNKKIAIRLDRSDSIKKYDDFLAYIADVKTLCICGPTPEIYLAEQKVDLAALFCAICKNCDVESVWNNIEQIEFDFHNVESSPPIIFNKKTITFNLDSAIEDAKAMQDLESESLLVGAEHSQKVKAAPTKSDYGSRGCVDLASSIAESRFKQLPEDFVKNLKPRFLKEAALFKSEILDKNDTAALLKNKRFYAAYEQWKKAISHIDVEALEVFALFCGYFAVIEYWNLSSDTQSYSALREVYFLIEAGSISYNDCISWLVEDVDFTPKLVDFGGNLENLLQVPLPSSPSQYVELWQRGFAVNLEFLYPALSRFDTIPLPLYPFQKTSVCEEVTVYDDIKKTLSETLKIPYDTISETTQFDELGITSLTIMQITESLSKTFGPLPATLLYEYTTISELHNYLGTLTEKPQQNQPHVQPSSDSIAIIGLSAKLPGGSTLKEFWDLLSQGRSSITAIPKDRWDAQDFFSTDTKPGTSYTFFGGVLDDIKRFDSLFFGISPREARQMDPQERLFLECSWNAIEDAGYKLSAIKNRNIGVFAGVTNGLYGWNDPELWQKQVHSNVSSAYWSVANRVSYCLNLTGPSLAVDTACSSSLTAIHLAIQSLQQKECDYALAGASSLLIHPRQYVELCDLKMLSTGPKLKSFGKDADGFVYGEGVGVVLLKRLGDAIKDNDPIYAVLCGSSIAATGKTSGYTVPNPTAQATVIQEAIKKAGIEPSHISYIEAHGTGTALGDPIEIRGLVKVFSSNTKPCLIGSVKSNIGHLEASAGIASLLKVIAQLQHRSIAATLHCEELNPKIDLEGTSLEISKTLQPWGDSPDEVLYAGISSFGAGGSNAHIVVSSAPTPVKTGKSHEMLPIILSAKENSALIQKAKELLQYVIENPTVSVRDISYTLAMGREHFSCRWICNCNSLEMLQTQLQKYIDTGTPSEAEYILPSYENCQRLHLPTYPFQGMPYWIAPKYKEQKMHNSVSPFTPVKSEVLENKTVHHFVVSTNEFYFKDHILNGTYILPGVVHLELARAANGSKTPIHFSKVTWAQPIILDWAVQDAKAMQDLESESLLMGAEHSQKVKAAPIKSDYGSRDCVDLASSTAQSRITSNNSQDLEIQIHITKKSDTRNSYKIMGLNGTVLHSQGEISTEPLQTANTPFSVKDYSTFSHRLQKQDVYRVLGNLGWKHGPSLQTIEAIYSSPQKSDAAIAYIQLEEMPDISQLSSIYPTFLHPSIMDGILQSVISPYIVNLEPNEKPALPFGFDALNIYTKIPLQGWVKIVRTTAEQSAILSHDLRFYDDVGTLCLELIGFKSKKERRENPLQHIKFYRKTWKETAFHTHDKPQNVVLVGANTAQQMQYTPLYGSTQVVNRHSSFEEWCQFFKKGPIPDAILYFVNNENAWETFEQMFSFTKAAIHSRLKNLQIVAIGSSRAAAFLVGFGKTLTREHPNFSLQVLIEPHKDINFWPQKSYSTAYTAIDGKLHEEKYAQVAFTPEKTLLKKQGCYIITGGLGGIGKELVEHLTTKYEASIVIASRRAAVDSKNIMHVQCDISSFEDTKNLLTLAGEKFGKIDGIFHAAGSLHDSLLYNKTLDNARKVFAPKVNGLINIHENLVAMGLYNSLDFLVSFSSISALLGNTGQSDYAAANACMDAYTQYIQGITKQYNTQILAINWPYWKTGGMQVSQEIEKSMQEKWGVSALKTADGLLALETLLQGKTNFASVLVAPDVTATFQKNLAIIEESSPAPTPIITLLKEIVKEIQELDVTLINPFTPLSDYGFDSISYTTLSNKLNETFSLDTTPAFFFEVSTLNDIADFITPKKPEKQNTPLHIPENTSYDDAIAIVGLSGKMPGAETLDEFWQNMIDGKDVISEIPQSRWKWQDYFGDPSTGNKTNVKYGGFIKDYDTFDADFFGINGREATFMDPQHRLFLEHAWSCIEDAGYTPDTLSQRKTGLFVGVSTHDYLTILSQHPEIDVYTSTGSVHCLLPNRVSYYLNLTGPSESIDTACSSSLVAIHRAITSLQSGECSFALAGGINALLHPIFYISFSKAGMLSEDGKCKTFDKAADGYVRGEGVGVVLLKRLKDALRDNDHIYATIRGSSVNHGGKTNTLTSPSPKSQSTLIQDALQRAKVDPRSISYIEAHGTGTPLGDPIEVNALKLAFREAAKNYPAQSQESIPYCGIGTVKTHIGHLEPAAGIAGVIKVLLALKHEVLPKARNFNSLNPYINLDNSPFYIQHKETAWPRRTHPRRAGVSSFGFGGVNGHLILEEHIPLLASQEALHTSFLITLSAKTATALATKIKDLLRWIEKNSGAFNLEDLSFTINIGRQPMAYRTAFIVSTVEELVATLKKAPRIQLVTDNKGQFSSIKDLKALQEAFLSGYQIDCEDFYKGSSFKRISLPTYPFEKKRYWLETSAPPSNDLRVSLQPYQNLIASHIVNGIPILPGIAVLSIIIQSVPLFNQGYTISSIVWFHPISAEIGDELVIKTTDTHIDILSADSTKIVCEIELKKETKPEDGQIDLEEIEETLSSCREQNEIYEDFKKKNINYGPDLKVLSSIQWNESCALATISPKITTDEMILEAGLQSLTVFSRFQQLPFKVGALSVNSPLQKALFVYAVAKKEGYTLYFLSRSSKIVATLESVVLQTKESAPSSLFAPYWTPVEASQDLPPETLIFSTSQPTNATHIAIDNRYNVAQEILDKAFDNKNISRIGIIIPPNDDNVRNTLLGFATFIQKLLHSSPSLTTKPLQLLLISSDPTSEASAIRGFASVLCREFENCGVCLVDLPSDGTQLTIPHFNKGVKTYAYRNHCLFERKWHSFSWGDNECGFKKGGVYVLVGGAGGLGSSLATYLVEQYNASVFLIGRSSKSMLPQDSLAHTNRVTYIQGDCSNRASLVAAIDEIKQHTRKIDGVIHSTLQLHDHPIAGITQEIINEVSISKIDGTVNCLDCFANESLDFFLIFSSVNSFLPQPGQGPYSAACSFQDSCIDKEYPCPIKVVNWGFWGELGAVAKPEYKDRFFKQGLLSIDPKQAWKDVDIFIKSDLLQMAYIPATREYYQNSELFVVERNHA